ncbi:MAG: tetratricopeptide repeat protein [Lamprobacter sp.]|uniref:O-linked N-acetylglucosamine transferase, SPINDLY family protein n=1 Tax=Lamprobacter sp. TaxID=3100796 RepID=UPI002B260F52|nr:tetratricopeptide repeat protein [Lamprobacter sp.]MEA3640878.1 tetratricopeptide repeat protein [Lamprobacter sp.]
MGELDGLLTKLMTAWRKGEQADFEKNKICSLLVDKPSYRQLHAFLSNLVSNEEKRSFLTTLTADGENEAEVLFLVGSQYFESGSLRLACLIYRDALERNPCYARAHRALGNALRLLGDLDGAIDAYRSALAIQPSRSIHSRLLLALNFSSEVSAKTIAEEHRRWGERYFTNRQPRRFLPAKLNKRKRLTIGYLSPDFRSHPVAYFIQPILAHHDHARYHIIGYYANSIADGVTARIKSMVDDWREVHDLRAADVAELILADDVDILVDLAGHTSGNRLDVLALKPAPVQVTYLGYPNSTGLSTVDYRITDTVSDPCGAADHWFSESLVRIDPVFLTFEPPSGCPPVEPTPASASGFITFGSFNKYSKLTQPTIETWTAILMNTAGSRLLLKTGGLEEEGEKARAIERFVAAGLDDAARIEIMGQVPSRTEHLGLYRRIDIALDPFPYNGTTTSCQALYMGVPMVSLAGDRHAARVGASLLMQLGLQRLIAQDIDDYVRIATGLAKDLDALVMLRQSLRPAMRSSPLLDHKGFVAKLEAAYRAIWDRASQTFNHSIVEPMI